MEKSGPKSQMKEPSVPLVTYTVHFDGVSQGQRTSKGCTLIDLNLLPLLDIWVVSDHLTF